MYYFFFFHFTDVNDKCPNVINDNEVKSIVEYESKVKGICEVLTRDHMKVAFFGRFVISFVIILTLELVLLEYVKFLFY